MSEFLGIDSLAYASDAWLLFIALAAVLVAALFLVIRSFRGPVKVFLTKAFFLYKYDYRKEWLRFIGILSDAEFEHVPRTAVRAVAPIVNSPGGIVWIQEEPGRDYLPVGAWRAELPTEMVIRADSSLIRFLSERQWVVDLNELRDFPGQYGGLALEPWFEEREDYWLIVPLFLGKELLGLIVLLKPKVMPRLNFEDHDLLKTVGRHLATHIKQAESDKRLAESSQFGTYHRLSAFLMHDLNNLLAQQSLVVKNAEKFRHDPKFVDDTIETIAHSVSRMRKLMNQLSRDSKAPTMTTVSVRGVVENAVTRIKPRNPIPTVDFADQDLYLMADSERLTVVLEHLIRNAQDATDDEGTVNVRTALQDGKVVIEIYDSGCGMAPEFISERLFRPFDSTKGSESMGIGAYQAREYARMLGGQLEVRSEVGKGTTFTLRLPALEMSQANQ